MTRDPFPRRSVRAVATLAAAIVAIAISLVAAPGGALATAAPGAGSGQGWARFGHFAPSQAPVDIYVDGAPFAAGIAYKNVSAYGSLSAGVHQFSVRPAGADAGSAPIAELDANVPDGAAVTISAVSTRQGLAAQVYDDALATPASGEALVRFIHATPDVAAVDVRVTGGAALASGLPYPQATSYLPVTPGTYDVDVVAAGTDEVLLHIAGWTVAAGTQASVVIIRGLDGGIDVAPVTDAAAVVAMPVGGVQTDLGRSEGPVPAGDRSLWPLLTVLSAVGAAGLFVGHRVPARARRAGGTR